MGWGVKPHPHDLEIDMNTILESINISKSYPGVQALCNVNFKCANGTIHGLVGENGAGKSTFIKIVSGALQPDSGSLLYKGENVVFHSPNDAIKSGIRVVYQEFALVPYLSIAENIFLGSLKKRGSLIDRNDLNRQVRQFLELLNISLEPASLVQDLSVAEQQFVEIIKAVSQRTSLLILDEPTAALNSLQVKNLFSLLNNLRDSGVGIIFISHRLPEVLEICQSITVMKDGRVVGDYENKQLSEDQLVSLMVGRELKYAFPATKSQKNKTELMKVDGVRSTVMKALVSIHLHKGEILGLFGLEGQGQREFIRTVAGLSPKSEGSIAVFGERIGARNPLEAIKNGIAYTPVDRKGEGLAISLPIFTNLGMPTLVRGNKFFVNRKHLFGVCQKQIQDLKIKLSSVNQPISSLSGGNQQKIVIGKWLSIDPKVLILDEPSRGIDVESKMEIYRILRELCDSGIGIMVLSSDLIELIGLCDRILVFHDGEITGNIDRSRFSEELCMTYATGISNHKGAI